MSDFYVVEHQIGKGSYGEVFLGHDIITHEPCAIKVIKKNPFNRKQKKFIERESAIMKTVDNAYIVQTLDVFESHGADGSLTIVSEYCGGGELFDLIIASQCFTEDKARHIMRQVLLGVDYLHSRGIVHRYVLGRGRVTWGGGGYRAAPRRSWAMPRATSRRASPRPHADVPSLCVVRLYCSGVLHGVCVPTCVGRRAS